MYTYELVVLRTLWKKYYIHMALDYCSVEKHPFIKYFKVPPMA